VQPYNDIFGGGGGGGGRRFHYCELKLRCTQLVLFLMLYPTISFNFEGMHSNIAIILFYFLEY
jgi:hypothetical protein